MGKRFKCELQLSKFDSTKNPWCTQLGKHKNSKSFCEDIARLTGIKCKNSVEDDSYNLLENCQFLDSDETQLSQSNCVIEVDISSLESVGVLDTQSQPQPSTSSEAKQSKKKNTMAALTGPLDKEIRDNFIGKCMHLVWFLIKLTLLCLVTHMSK